MTRHLTQRTAPAPISQGNPLISDAKLKQLYGTMLKCSILEKRAAHLHKQKRRSALPFAGREAAIVSAAVDLRRDDWIAPPPKDFISGWIKGLPLSTVWTRLNDPGTDNQAPATAMAPAEDVFAHAHIVPSVASMALQLQLAVGVAIACKCQNKRAVTMAFFAGHLKLTRDVSETLALAAARQLPLVAVSCGEYPLKATAGRRTKPGHSRERLNLLGIPVIPVDGSDAVAMYRVAHESIHKARYSGGPTLIEAMPGVAANRRLARTIGGAAADPIGKMEQYLTAKGLFSASWQQRLVSSFNLELDAAVTSS